MIQTQVYDAKAERLPKSMKSRASNVVDHRKGRSWLEISTENLRYNANLLRNLMPPGCEMMAVVKANAYGHGAVKVSKCMNEIGVRAFAVATIDEGIELRRNGIQGEILILGYTDVSRAKELHHYNLIQTIIDYYYALLLNNSQYPIQAHIKIDTGMHRLGICVEEADRVAEVFCLDGLEVSGIYTHLCVADNLEAEEVKYTQGQIERFYMLLEFLKDRGITIPKVHIQSSYGLLNYPELRCDYVRIGIALYGSLSSEGDKTRRSAQLRPVLSLKAKVILIREVASGESVGYGRDFILREGSRVAVVPVGYADGIPRNLSYGRGKVLLHGRSAPVIGRICMDQLLIDVTEIPEAKPGDVATLIGTDGQLEIPATKVAKRAGSITNELFSRLGGRLERVYR